MLALRKVSGDDGSLKFSKENTVWERVEELFLDSVWHRPWNVGLQLQKYVYAMKRHFWMIIAEFSTWETSAVICKLVLMACEICSCSWKQNKRFSAARKLNFGTLYTFTSLIINYKIQKVMQMFLLSTPLLENSAVLGPDLLYNLGVHCGLWFPSCIKDIQFWK